MGMMEVEDKFSRLFAEKSKDPQVVASILAAEIQKSVEDFRSKLESGGNTKSTDASYRSYCVEKGRVFTEVGDFVIFVPGQYQAESISVPEFCLQVARNHVPQFMLIPDSLALLQRKSTTCDYRIIAGAVVELELSSPAKSSESTTKVKGYLGYTARILFGDPGKFNDGLAKACMLDKPGDISSSKQ